MPTYVSKKPRLVVWLDTSDSMFTSEHGLSRIQIGLTELIQKTDKNNFSHFTLRILGRPGYERIVHSAIPNIKNVIHDSNLTSPSPIKRFPTIKRNSRVENWLITDGSEKNIQSWVNSSYFSKILNVGRETENTEINYMAVRKSLYANHYYGFVKISNFGLHANKRELIIKSDKNIIFKKTIDIKANHPTLQNFSFNPDNKIRMLSAQLLPSDNLAIDDRLVLNDITHLWHKLSVNFEGKCPQIIHSIFSAYPNLDVETTRANSDLSIMCGKQPQAENGPYLFISNSGHEYVLDDYPTWHSYIPRLNKIYLDPHDIVADAIIPNSRKWQNLLTYGSHTLIRFNKNKKHLEMYINLSHSPLTKKILFPVIFNKLIELLLDSSVLDIHKSVKSVHNDSNIAPIKIQTNTTQKYKIGEMLQLNIAFIILTIILLATEAVLKYNRHKLI